MIYDPDAFLSRTGGQDRTSRLLTPTGTAVGDIGVFALLDSNLFSRTVLKPLFKEQIQSGYKRLDLRYPRGVPEESIGAFKTIRDRYRRAASELHEGRVLPEARGWSRAHLSRDIDAMYDLQDPKRDRRLTARRRYRSQVERSFKSSRAFIKGISWAMIGTAMFDVMSEAATPGITEAAEQYDNEMLAMEQYFDSSAAFTQRQRALQAIHDSQLSIRNVIGNEASYFHI